LGQIACAPCKVDLQGRLIQALSAEQVYPAGRQTLQWNLAALRLAPGSYTLRLQIGNTSIARIIVKS
jgi:hypothetical protein